MPRNYKQGEGKRRIMYIYIYMQKLAGCGSNVLKIWTTTTHETRIIKITNSTTNHHPEECLLVKS